MRTQTRTGLAAVTLAYGLLSIASTVAAVELGNTDAGLKFAAENCAECHEITSRNSTSTTSGAPTFYVVANTSGISRTSLLVWMQSSHRKMPNLMIGDQDLDNVIAYILSLKDK